MDFVHLHNHTDYSILDGAITVDKLVKKAAELGMKAVALTDHGNMFGAIDFYQAARKAGIKPIIGEEFYMAPGPRTVKESSRNNGEEKAYHLILLARSAKGYRNLMKLSSIGYVEGFYYKPRIDFEVLERHSEGLVCSSACLGGQIPSLILRGKDREARELAGRFREIFGKDNFYLELQYHNIAEQETVNRELVKMGVDMDIPLIATNDAHYVNREDARSHEVLLCVQTGKLMKDTDRMKFPSDEFYLKSADEMRSLFPDYPDAMFNTLKIAEMVEVELELGKPILPHFEVPDGFNLDTYLRHLVEKGAAVRYGGSVPDEVRKRIDYELSVIINMKFSGYFLVVWDVINYARQQGVPVGPGRGSAAGSMVSYCLGITALDPLRYDLLFERFLNPERNEMPDMDLDFCADRRGEVIDYVRAKYGDDHVSQIITFNTMSAKAVIKDVARAMDIPFTKANEISKLIEEKELAKSLAKSKEFQALHRDREYGKDLIDTSLRLEGLVRSAGRHAAGIVISRGPLTDYVPLYMDKDGAISSQYEKNALEKAGLVKMDFLGLKNLTIIDKCLKLIRETKGETVDIDAIPLDDKKSYDLLKKADTKGVFQLESGGMQTLLRRLGPTCFEDIIAIVALYRPGPLNSGMADDFIKRKRNPKLVDYPHRSLEAILKDTLGVVVYQEQVMRISQIIAGFTMPEADKLRKAMGKKNMDIINALEDKFLKGAQKNGIDKNLAENLYNMIKKFGEYGFNKSHSAAYALVAYQTAFLKAHYPLQYMTSLLSAQPDRQDDVIQYINDCRANGIDVLPPSVNRSDYDFTIEGKSIRFGLSAIKGVGSKAIESIVAARKRAGNFDSLKDFLENIDSLTVNKGVLESLIKAGAMDCLHENRAQLFASIDILLEAGRRLQEDRASGQGNLFGGEQAAAAGAGVHVDLLSIPEWHDNEKLSHEKEVLGLYISSHPLAKFEKEIRMFSSVSLSNLSEEHNGRSVSVVGILTNLQVKRAQKTGKRYALAELEDMDSSVEVIIFEKVLSRHEQLVMSGAPLMVTGTIEAESDTLMKLIATAVKSLKEVRQESISALHIRLDAIGVDDDILKTMEAIFTRHKGDCPIFFHVNAREGEKIIKAHATFNVKPTDGLVKDLSQIVGQDSLGFSISHH
ncbi:MAG: DNA polymerase III subunit alpha [Spirochaetes bacterium]|nr:DNA polymerase III subunit alpha [Spirochaetota bacterium]